MPRGSLSTPSARATGLLIAVAMLLIGAGVVLYVSIGTRGRQASVPVPSDVIDLGAPPVPGEQRTGVARMQFADKKDPDRLAGELLYDRLDPLGSGRYAVEQPRAWIYLQDGRTLHVRADEGRIRMPGEGADGSRPPEDGEFSGNVVVRMFPAPDPSTPPAPIDPEEDRPGLIARTESLQFATALLELSTDQRVEISSPLVWFECVGLRVRGDQVRDRVALLQTRESGRMLHTPEPRGGAERTAAASAASPRPARAMASADPFVGPPAPVPAPKEDLYHAVFRDDVVVTQTGRRLAADTLDVWVRTLDNKLPVDAVGDGAQPRSARRTDRGREGPAAAYAGGAGATPLVVGLLAAINGVAGPVESLYAAGDDEITLSWTGTLTLLPVERETPPELRDGHHLTLRFTGGAGEEARVTLADRSTGAAGVCDAVEYRASTRQLTLSSRADGGSVVMVVPGAGRMEAPELAVNLRSGEAFARGEGRLASLRDGAGSAGTDLSLGPPPPPAPADPGAPLDESVTRLITWTDRADFQFRAADGKIQGDLERAAFTGNVAARDRLSLLRGQRLETEFEAVAEEDGSGGSTPGLRRVRVIGDVIAVAGQEEPDHARVLPSQDPYVRAQELDVTFAPSEENPEDVEPRRAVATGSVLAADASASVRAQRLEVDLVRNGGEGLEPSTMVATGDVVVQRRDGVSARADRIEADGQKGTAAMTGEIVAVARGDSTILGKQMQLEEGPGMLRVFGGGSLDHIEPPSGSGTDPGPTRVRVTWAKSMEFNNQTGHAACHGDVVAVATSPLEDRTTRGERILLELSPDPAGGSAELTVAPEGEVPAASDRRVLRAEAVGSIMEYEDGANATVQSITYAAPAEAGTDRRPLQVTYLEGARILVDDVAGTLSVPAAGQGLVYDARESGGDEASATAPAPPAPGLPVSDSPRGTSRFVWGGSMHFDRDTGELDLRREVELTHKPLHEASGLRLVCADLKAFFAAAPEANRTSDAAELLRVTALGAVYAESEDQQLVCDTLAYDAQRGTVLATANEGGQVTLYDTRRPAPSVAAELFWDLVKDRIEIRKPAPIVAPR